MDTLLYYFFVITNFNYSIEYLFIQIVILYIFALLILNDSLYYSLLYLLLLVFYFGLLLCCINNELVAGFLWVTELIVVFVLLLLLLYVNVSGAWEKSDFKKNIHFFYVLIFVAVFLLESDPDFYESQFLFMYADTIWFDYYESANNEQLNDFFGFFLSYYTINTLIFLILGIILFFGSIVCVLLFRLIKVIKFNNVNNFFETFKFSQSFLYSIFMRKQDLFDQSFFVYGVKMVFSKND